LKVRPWLLYAVLTTVFWGIWGALIELPEKAGFPATLGYSVWAITMIFPAIAALKIIGWKLEYDRRSIILGCIIGFTGAGGQLVLFQALRTGPAYLVFPFISLSPVITVILALIFLKEKASKRGWTGIIMALLAIPLLSYQSPQNSAASGYTWIILSLVVFFAWGLQAYVMRFANQTMKAESIFFYMTVTGIILIPFAVMMTDFSVVINWGLSGMWLAGIVQLLNAVGALMIVYAFRYGKAIIVSPLTNAVAPVITIIISLSIYRVIPNPVILTGMFLALAAILLMTIDDPAEVPVEKISEGGSHELKKV
jgi:drug/metabolite transporter (DMT)-like permease